MRFFIRCALAALLALSGLSPAHAIWFSSSQTPENLSVTGPDDFKMGKAYVGTALRSVTRIKVCMVATGKCHYFQGGFMPSAFKGCRSTDYLLGRMMGATGGDTSDLSFIVSDEVQRNIDKLTDVADLLAKWQDSRKKGGKNSENENAVMAHFEPCENVYEGYIWGMLCLGLPDKPLNMCAMTSEDPDLRTWYTE